MAKMFPGRHLSIIRLGMLIAIITVLVFGSWAWLNFTKTTSRPLPSPWFGGYVDVTATPSYAFESDVGSQYDNVILGFVTSKNKQCTPSWGGYDSPDEAAARLDLDSRIANAYSSNRSVTISFGGQSGTELAQTCTTTDELVKAYTSIINRYQSTSIDFDLEGDNLGRDTSASTRRVQAISRIIKQQADDHHDLNVDLTIPVGTHGMTAQGLDTVRLFLENGIIPAKLNLMTMDYGVASTHTAQSDVIAESLKTAHRQYLQLLYARGWLFDDSQIWKLMGATVLIGQNDTKNEYLTTDDAQKVNTFAQSVDLGRLSMWSLNRDRQCGSNYAGSSRLVTFCSGMRQTDGQFATTLGAGFKGRPGTIVGIDAIKDSHQTHKDTTSAAPYARWSGKTSYITGDKVIYENSIYQALSVTKGVAPTESDPDSPWRYIGPVL